MLLFFNLDRSLYLKLFKIAVLLFITLIYMFVEMDFKKYLLVYFVYRKDRRRKRGGEAEEEGGKERETKRSSSLWFTFQMPGPDHSWDSHGAAGSKHRSLHLVCPRLCMVRRLESEVEPELEDRRLYRECCCLTQCLNCYTQKLSLCVGFMCFFAGNFHLLLAVISTSFCHYWIFHGLLLS